MHAWAENLYASQSAVKAIVITFVACHLNSQVAHHIVTLVVLLTRNLKYVVSRATTLARDAVVRL